MPFLAAIPAAAWLAGGIVGAAGLSLISSSKAASGATGAAETTAKAQEESLAYLKERERIPQAYRDQALQELGGIYGLPGAEGGGPQDGGAVSPYTDRPGFLEGITDDPFYKMLVSQGEEGALSQLSATGKLRSGTAFEALGRNRENAFARTYGQRYDEFQDYEGGLRGVAGLPSNAPQIAQTISRIGETRGQGQVAAGQAWQQGFEGFGNTLMSGTGTALKYGII